MEAVGKVLESVTQWANQEDLLRAAEEMNFEYPIEQEEKFREMLKDLDAAR